MSKPADFFDLEAYQKEVLLYVQLQRIEENGSEIYAKYPQTKGWVYRQFDDYFVGSWLAEQRTAVGDNSETAEKLLKRKTILRIICPGLPSGSADALAIAKHITPVLVDAVLTGKVAIPLEPAEFAAMALTLARSDPAALCAEHSTSN